MTMTTMSKIFMGVYFLVLVLFRVIAMFTLSGLVPVDRVIADAGRCGARLLSEEEHDSEDDNEHPGTHHDLANDQQADPCDRDMNREGEDCPHHEEKDS